MAQRTNTYHLRRQGEIGVTVQERFVYDSQNRLLQHYHKVDDQTEVLLAENTYNELSQLSNKKVGNNLQSIDYNYNIRGWLSGINRNQMSVPDLGGKLFSYKIKYNEKEGITSPDPAQFPGKEVAAKYNGNIAEVDWRSVESIGSSPSITPKRYGYVYDRLNRLTAGFYQTPNNAGLGENTESLTYDLNGNITKLFRTSVLEYGNTTPTKIDDLEYIYEVQNKSNKLITINDSSFNSSGYEGGGMEIKYDLNGNMTEMPDKTMNIQYNYLNLPSVVNMMAGFPFDVEYAYRADGVKLRKKSTSTIAGINSVTTIIKDADYLDGFQYNKTTTTINGGGGGPTDPPAEAMAMAPQARAMEMQAYSLDNFVPLDPTPVMLKNPDLEFFPTAEGFYDYKKDQYIYQYKDHLGNVRVSFGRNSAGALELVDVNDYYPFGMNHLKSGNSFFGVSSYKNYKYQGQELQETGFYSFKWRNYMPDVGRFFNIDPLSEKYSYQSHYNFSENRVIDGRELEGLEWVSVKNDQGKTTERQLTVSITNDTRLNERQYNRLIESIKNDFSNVFGTDGVKAQLVISDNETMRVSLGNQVSETLTNAEGNEYSTYKGGVTATLGESQNNSFSVTATVDGTRRNTSDITRSFNHEAAHSAGLDHPWENRDHVTDINQNSPSVQPDTIKSNLLNSGANPNPNYNLNANGTSLTSGQFNSMDRKIQSQQPQQPQPPQQPQNP